MAISFRVIGEPMRAGMIGAAIARYCGGENCEIVPKGKGAPNHADIVLMRPDHLRFHAELHIDPAQVEQQTGARRVYAYRPVSGNNSPLVPFSPFGITAQGTEFHHLWLRADKVKAQPPLEAFCAAIALSDQGPVDPARAPDLAFGLECSRLSYAQLLLSHAQSLGARIEDEPTNAPCDIVIDCGPGEEGDPIVWEASRITIAPDGVVAGEEWQSLINATRRLAAMVADPASAQAEQREFNRLSAASEERMADFRGLLTEADPRSTDRPALQRKIEVFEACGRIPTEDYEVYAPFEWLAAFWSRDIRPHRHERLADRMSEPELLAFMSDAHARTQSMARREVVL